MWVTGSLREGGYPPNFFEISLRTWLGGSLALPSPDQPAQHDELGRDEEREAPRQREGPATLRSRRVLLVEQGDEAEPRLGRERAELRRVAAPGLVLDDRDDEVGVEVRQAEHLAEADEPVARLGAED